MKDYISYDQTSDSLYIFGARGAEEDVLELIPGVNVELDRSGRVIGIEILRASWLLANVRQPKTSGRRVIYRVREAPMSYKTKRRSERNKK